MSEIIFVCTGNTCRSPMAAALAAAIFAREGLDFSVSSCGVCAGNSAANKNAILAMQAQKLDLASHKSQPATKELLESAALVLTMTRSHLSQVKAICPTAAAFTLGEFSETLADVLDPFGGNLDEYLSCAAQIKKLLEASLEKFRGM